MSENDKKGTVGQTSDPIKQPHTLEEIVPSTTPLTIPYLEIYRTNELEYQEYQSPYLNQNSSGDAPSDSGDEESGDSASEQARASKLWTDLANLIWEYYPKLQKKDDFIRDLRDAEVSWTSIAKQVNKRGNPVKETQDKFIEKVLQLKEGYARTDRKTYSSMKNIIVAGGKVINASPKAQKVVNLMQNAKYYDPSTHQYRDDVATQRVGNLFNNISTISKMETTKTKKNTKSPKGH